MRQRSARRADTATSPTTRPPRAPPARPAPAAAHRPRTTNCALHIASPPGSPRRTPARRVWSTAAATFAFASPTIVFGCTRTPISSSVSASCCAPADDVRLDLRRGPGIRHSRPPPSSPPGPSNTGTVRTVCQLAAPHTRRHPYYARSRTSPHRHLPGEAMSERLQPGDTAPAFTLPDADGNEVSLADHKGRKVIVYFYPAALTPGCTKQACDFTRQPRPAGRRRLRRHRRLPRQAGEARQVPREGEPQGHPGRRPRQGGPRGLRRLRREEALRQDGHRRHPLHGHRRRGGQGRTRPLQRQGDRPRRQDHQGPGHLTTTTPM